MGGKGEYRTLVFQLKYPRDKGTLFAHVKNLKGIKNGDDKSFQIREHLSPKEFADRKKKRQLYATNKKSTISKLTMSFEKSKLKVNNEEFASEIRPPSVRQVIFPTTEDLANRLRVNVVQGDMVEVEGQQFIGYTACVQTLTDVNAAYARVCAQHTDARHVVGACRLPGEAWHILQDYNDDDEHRLGAELLHVLASCKIYNRAVFVARKYDGSHIGVKRIDAMVKAATSAILTAPLNEATGVHQFPWEQEPASARGGTIRGRGRRG